MRPPLKTSLAYSPPPHPPSPPCASDIKMDKSQRSKGWGIVKFNTLEEAHAAIAGMNGTDCEGRAMEVRLDRGAVTREEGAEGY
jgi:RNA recognition motif-containing protein